MKTFLSWTFPAFALIFLAMSFGMFCVGVIDSVIVKIQSVQESDQFGENQNIRHNNFVVNEVQLQVRESAWETAHAKVKNSLSSRVKTFGERGLAGIDAWLSRVITGKLRSTQVLQGKEEWLFYKSKTDGDSICDFCGEGYFGNDYAESLLSVLRDLREKINARGARLVLFIPPNKEIVYFDKMPDTICRKSEVSRTEKLTEFLQSAGFCDVVYAKYDLLAAKQKVEVYYPLDTHWNELGGYVGVQTLIKALGRIPVPLDQRKLVQSKKVNGMDLAKIANVQWALGSQPNRMTIEGLPDPLNSGSEELELYCRANVRDGNGRILLVGDSFRVAMVAPLLEHWESVYVIHRKYCDNLLELVDETKPEVVVIEFVERYAGSIRNLLLEWLHVENRLPK